MNDTDLVIFEDSLIDVLILWHIGYTSGYSFYSSLDYATRHLPEPAQTLWRKQLDKQDNALDVMIALREDVPSDGLVLMHDKVLSFVEDNSIDIRALFESLLETLWSRYSLQTKPDSTNFNDVSRLIRAFNDTNHPDHDYAIQQFRQMQHHAIAYFDAAIMMGYGDIGQETITWLAAFNTPHTRRLLQIMAKSQHYADDAQAALDKLAS